MTMPVDLILVRHGQSEGNVAKNADEKGDDSHFTEDFRIRHASQWRLTDKGRQQATIAGKWIKENILLSGKIDRFYTSSYVRAMESALMLDLPNALWTISAHLRERDIGDLSGLTVKDRENLFANSFAHQNSRPFYWRPPNGESLAEVTETSTFRFFDTLHRECSEMSVIAVMHGEKMWTCRIAIEGMTEEMFLEVKKDKPFSTMHNCQIIMYTRKNPVTGILESKYRWMKSVCPTNLSLSRNEWVEFAKPKFTNDDLRRMVNSVPQIIR